MIPLIIFAIGTGVLIGTWYWKQLAPQDACDFAMSLLAGFWGMVCGGIIFVVGTKAIDLIIEAVPPSISLWWLF